MLRDSATAAVLGMSAGSVMDSFVFAFRIPDIARRMFGEGSFSIGFIPVFTRLWHEDREKAWKLLTVAMSRMFVFLGIIVILGEILCIAGMRFFPDESRWNFVAHLVSLMLPYLILIGMTSLSVAALQSIGSFAPGAAVPMILNITWLFGLLIVSPRIAEDPEIRCYLLTVCILIAGVIQFLMVIPFLRRHGAIVDYDPAAVKPEIRSIAGTFFQQIFGLVSIQIYILIATVFAWMLSGYPENTVPWLGSMVKFPMEPGATAAIYFSERLYEFPQGMLGLAVATAIYPLLGRHAAKKDFRAISDALGFGLRLVLVLAIPAGLGLAILSENLSHLLYQRYSFTKHDMFRTADMIFWFSGGVWSFCAIPILVRGFYVMDDHKSPLRIGFYCMFIQIFLCGTLIWVMSERGLALATVITAGIQAFWLLFRFSRIYKALDMKKIAKATGRSVVASTVMAGAVCFSLETIPGHDSFADILHVFFAMCVGLPVFGACYWILGGRVFLSLSVGDKDDTTGKKRKKRKNRRR